MKKTHLIALVVMALAAAVLITMSGEFSSYSNFSTAIAAPDRAHQVVGHLSLDKPIVYDPVKDPNQFSFFMKDENNTEMQVVCKIAKPQDFERSEQIVLTGRTVNGQFHADHIQLKCPSKYQDEQIQNGTADAKASGM